MAVTFYTPPTLSAATSTGDLGVPFVKTPGATDSRLIVTDQEAALIREAFPTLTEVPYPNYYRDMVKGTLGLLLYYRLNETSGTQAADLSGLGNHGTWGGAGSPTRSVAGALTDGDLATGFPGATSAYITTPILAANGGAFSFEGWAYKADTAANYTLLASASTGGGGDMLVRFPSGGSAVNFWPQSSSGNFVWAAGVPTAAYFHWVLTFDEPNDTAILYINGVSKGTLVSTAKAFSGVAGNFFKLGSRGGGSEGWLGRQDEVAIYNRVLTANEALQHYNAGTLGY